MLDPGILRAIPAKHFCLLLHVFLFLVASAYLPAQTLPSVPLPTGKYSVGSQEFSLLDKSRPETITEDPNDRRELYVRVWYPAQTVPKAAKPMPIFGTPTMEIAAGLSAALNMPKGALNFLAYVSSSSFADVRLAAGKKFPVIVFSHGYFQGFAAQNVIQMEELASRGYVVFAVGHTYETIVNVFPDGRVVPAGRPPLGRPNPKAAELAKKIRESKVERERVALTRRMLLLEPFNERLRVWTADVRFLLDEIERMNSGNTSSVFAKRLNMERIGVMGMSFGGATAGQVCLEDSRCRAGVNMDGTQYGDLFTAGLKRPFMFMEAEESAEGSIRHILDSARTDAYHVVIRNAKHWNFSNFNLLAGFDPQNRILGKIPGDRMESIMNRYLVAFFDKYLSGMESPLLKRGSPDIPEVTFSAKSRR